MGCGITYPEYLDETWAAECARMEECGFLGQIDWTLEDCLSSRPEDAESTTATTCDAYDHKKASECLTALQTVPCDSYLEGRRMEACNLVCENP